MIKNLLIFALVVVMVASCRRVTTSHSASATPASTRILFIGNSFTYFNNGIDRYLNSFAPSSKASSVALGGYTLENHWNNNATQQALHQGGWGYVVLQEQSQVPIFDPTGFHQFAVAFDRKIKAIGAKTILFMTWERPDSVSQGVTTQNLASAYNNVGAELGAKVAPVGLAFARSLSEKPDLSLYNVDGHPTIYGTYLATCVLYGTIFERSPEGNPYIDKEISTELQTYLQKTAAKTLGYE